MLEMRELRGDDIFQMMSILSKLDIEDKIVELFEDPPKPIKIGGESEKGKAAREKAYEEELQKRGMRAIASIAKMVLKNIKYAKEEINEFLAEITNTSLEEIEGLNLPEYTGLVMGFFRKKELADTMRSIISLLSMEEDTK